jgi:hypothetical protein
MRRLVPPFPTPGPGASQQPVPRYHRYYGFVRILCILCASSPVSLDWRYSFTTVCGGEGAEVLPKFLGNPCEHVSRASDSGGSSEPR